MQYLGWLCITTACCFSPERVGVAQLEAQLEEMSPQQKTRQNTDKNLYHRLFPASACPANVACCDVLKHQEEVSGPPMGTFTVSGSWEPTT